VGVELPGSLEPLAFLVGTWAGEGVGGYPTIPDFRFGQELRFEFYGKPVLAYSSRSWSLDDERPLARESGFWRMAGDDVEVLMAQQSGLVEVFLGRVEGHRIEIATDVVARTPSAKDVSADRRLYGLVGEDLAYAMDLAAVGESLAPHLSARLRRVG
jgi:hypothetical protein